MPWAEWRSDVGYFVAVQVNQRPRISPLAREFHALPIDEECPLYDCTGPHRPEQAVYLHRARAAADDYRTARRAAHADRHFSGHSYPRDRRGLAVHRSAAGSDGRTDHHAVSACADDDGQRYRTHRREFLQWLRHRQDFLSTERRYPHRQCPGHRDLANPDQADAARCDAATDPELQ